MLAYNIWRYLKLFAQLSVHNDKSAEADNRAQGLQGVVSNTIRIARLKLLFIAAKIVRDSNRDKVKYSVHDARTSAMMNFLKFLDRARSKSRPWLENSNWSQRFSLQTV